MPSRRWPAHALTVLFLAYTAGKAVYAVRGRLGFPGGPPVSTAETASYPLDPALAQWLACASGLAGACVAMATVTTIGHRRIPRKLLFVAVVGLALAVVAGGGIMVLDGFVGLGIGWRWYHGVLGAVMIGLAVATVREWLNPLVRMAP